MAEDALSSSQPAMSPQEIVEESEKRRQNEICGDV
jgi:hypothetical protein